MSKEAIVTELEQLGFTSNEANVYVALIQTGPLTATAIAAATGLARTAVYPTLNSLVDQGLVDAGEGYGCKFSAVPAERALPHLMLERERITKQIIERISSLEERAEKVPGELVQVIRSPRAVAERYERLQLEAKTKVEVFVKPPVFVRPDNPVQEACARRGVHYKALYERTTIEDPAIKPYLSKFVADGEEARVYDGELPHKLAIFDSAIVLMPLVRPGEQTQTVLIRHPQLCQTLSLAFHHLWQLSEPIRLPQTSGKRRSRISRRRAVRASRRDLYDAENGSRSGR
jgi:sugar-specific transcriptional regulator TrmB